jgi:hypothetical protein
MRSAVRTVLVLAVLVTAGLGGGSARGAAGEPVNTSPPTIEGKLFAGLTIRAGNGGWVNGPTRFAYQWLRCDEKGASCARIPGATSSSYTLTSSDVGHTMIVLVTASNSAGSTGPVNSKPSKVVSEAEPPKAATAPTISGRAIVGEILLAVPGKYAGGVPERFAYRWQRCSGTGTSCANVSGETKQTYTIRATDEDNTLRVVVRATNTYGSDMSTSAPTAVVKKQAVVTVTSSLTASTSVVTCCQSATLSGTVSNGKAGEPITILAQEFEEDVFRPIGSTTTSSSGQWSFNVRPSIETLYQAKTSTSTTPALTIRMHPRVGLGFQRGIFSTKVTGGSGATSFAGKVVFFQRRTAAGSWRTLEKVVLDLNSTARFHKKLPRGVSIVRVYLTKAQAGPGYLDGVSHTRRFTRR